AAQGAVVAIDAEGLDATPGAGHALQRRRAIDTVEEAPVRGGAHAIAVEVRDFLSGRAVLLQRAIGHVDTENVDTAALRRSEEGDSARPRSPARSPSGLAFPADIGKQ